MKSWQCIVCGFVYDEAKGLPEDGIPAAQIAVYQNLTLKWYKFLNSSQT
jgi:rubredoxin